MHKKKFTCNNIYRRAKKLYTLNSHFIWRREVNIMGDNNNNNKSDKYYEEENCSSDKKGKNK